MIFSEMTVVEGEYCRKCRRDVVFGLYDIIWSHWKLQCCVCGVKRQGLYDPYQGKWVTTAEARRVHYSLPAE